MKKITESDSNYQDLEKKPIRVLLEEINQEDSKVPQAVAMAIPQIEALIEHLVPKMALGGRLFYIGAGTSGRLGIVDASECPPTFGIPHDWVIGIIAGGDVAIRKAVEHAEDDINQAWKDLSPYQLDDKDTVIGIAASGSTPYVVGGLEMCQKMGIATGAITCNPDAPICRVADFPISVIVGPEYLTGSTRMKAGTAQKLVLNMITTSTMIRLGRVKGNKMVDMQLTNNKLIDRGVQMILQHHIMDYEQAEILLKKHGSVRQVLQHLEAKQ
jgi:N-acetylmuramic acid 6-phosphate etherase